MPEPLNLPDNPQHCPTCNTPFQGNFCYACGEKKPSKKDYTLKKYLTQALDIFTHFDGKFFTTIKYLLFYPGKLTEENLAGRKVRLMKPLQLYVILSLVYFFLMKSIDVFLSYLQYEIEYDAKILETAKNHAAKAGLTLTEYIGRFDAILPNTSKTFIFILVPMIAIGIWILYFRKSKQFVPHLIFSTHLFSFILVFTLIYFQGIIYPLHSLGVITKGQRFWVIGFDALVMTAYIFFSLKRVYKQNVFVTAIKSLGLIIWIAALVGVYRFGITWTNFLIV